MKKNVSSSSLEEKEEADRRAFRRLAVGVRVRFHEMSLRRPDLEYLRGVAEDMSLGGMFIATRHTFPVSTALSLEFHAREGGGAPVRAKVVVCWRRRWREPRGMGVRFVELEGLGQRHLETWMETVLAPESISA